MKSENLQQKHVISVRWAGVCDKSVVQCSQISISNNLSFSIFHIGVLWLWVAQNCSKKCKRKSRISIFEHQQIHPRITQFTIPSAVHNLENRIKNCNFHSISTLIQIEYMSWFYHQQMNHTSRLLKRWKTNNNRVTSLVNTERDYWYHSSLLHVEFFFVDFSLPKLFGRKMKTCGSRTGLCGKLKGKIVFHLTDKFRHFLDDFRILVISTTGGKVMKSLKIPNDILFRSRKSK